MKSLQFPLVCFDLDGTLVDDTVFIWQTLHDQFRTDLNARKMARADYLAGRISYADWFHHDLELLDSAGATREKIADIVRTLTPMPGALNMLEDLKKRGHTLAIISGSLDIVVEMIFGLDLFKYVYINKIHFREDGRIAGGTPTPYDFEGKAEGLKDLARQENLHLDSTVFVGDNDNDVWIAKAAGLAIAVNCKSPELKATCHCEIKGKDLTPLSAMIS
ncbi:MAG: HAD family phosphatase [Myxococcota bacterium]|nr:HAD family phosphatase [Myxococcota bacterium]